MEESLNNFRYQKLCVTQTRLNKNAEMQTGYVFINKINRFVSSYIKILRIPLLLVLIVAVVLFNSSITQAAASYCVRAGASGDNNGSSWSNAFTKMPSSLERGATYYVADGNYPSYTFDDDASGSTWIYIKKATIAKHGTDTGWSDSYGDGQATFNAPLTFYDGYYEIDGQTRDEENWFDGSSYGFKVYHNNTAKQINIGRACMCGMNHITLKHVYVQARQNMPTAGVGWYAIDIYNGGGSGFYSNLLFHKIFVQYGCVHVLMRNSSNSTIEYSAFDDNDSNANNHGEVTSTYYTNSSWTFRYNKLRNIIGTAVFAINAGSGYKIYGNVMWDLRTGDGAIGFLGDGWSNSEVYNNTIVNGNGSSGVSAWGGSNNLVKNNLWVNCNSVGFNGVTQTYNTTDGSASLFNNYANDDFTLATAPGAGEDLSSTFTKDLLGNTFGADGVWDRGAYEFNSNSLLPPENFRFQD